MIRAVFVQNETLGAYKTEVTIFTGRSVSISESHLENVLWALFLYSTEGALLKCGPKHLISGYLPLLLCVGAKLNLDETKDLLARAGYALSPADLTDIIFTFFIEHKHYDVIDIDIQLEEHGLPCIIS